MPFTKTEVDIHTDYLVEAVDPEWLAKGVKSPKHLMLDPDNCILCRACEDVCPWNCIFMMSPNIVEEADDDSVEAEVGAAGAVFVVHLRRLPRLGERVRLVDQQDDAPVGLQLRSA